MPVESPSLPPSSPAPAGSPADPIGRFYAQKQRVLDEANRLSRMRHRLGGRLVGRHDDRAFALQLLAVLGLDPGPFVDLGPDPSFPEHREPCCLAPRVASPPPSDQFPTIPVLRFGEGPGRDGAA